MFDVQHWLASGGVILLAAIVFAESGLLFGFFLPGDSLLFIAGFLTSGAGGHTLPALPLTAAIVFVAAAGGDQVGYLLGRRFGASALVRPRSRLFNPHNVERTRAFFAAQGPKAVVLARFVPVVRTFTPMVAGVGGMEYRTFTAFNLIGAAAWGVGLTTLGHFLGEVEVIKEHIDLAVVAIVAVSLVPVLLEYRRTRRTRAAG